MIDGPGLRVIQPRRMPPVPMHAALQRHIEPDQDNRPGTELKGKIERLKPPIAAPPDDARNVEYQFVAPGTAFDLVDVSVALGSVPVLRELQSLEFFASFVDTPPLPVAGVEGFGPGTDLVCVVNTEGFALLFPRGFESDGFD